MCFVGDQSHPAFLQVATDLCDEWWLLWMNCSDICQLAFASKAQAVAFITDYLNGEACEGGLETVIAIRGPIDKRLLAGSGAA